jgi:phosphopentomutase
VYRYIDARLGEVHDLLDADDVMIAMSDHGIRTAMEHSRHALFVVAGPGVPVGRAAGSPPLRGVPRMVADLLDVTTDWSDAGLAPWARALARTAE